MELERSDEIKPGKIHDFSGNPINELDFPPEFYQYRDEGCDLAESCLNCPFKQCIYDEPGGKQRLVKNLRDKEIARLFTFGSKGVKELSEMFSVSRRTVQRVLKNTLDNSSKEKSKE
ncbi:hypothetical protein ACFLWR_06660 [Chloroflexota bacterium]